MNFGIMDDFDNRFHIWSTLPKSLHTTGLSLEGMENLQVPIAFASTRDYATAHKIERFVPFRIISLVIDS
jgi:hypothetical protein